MEWHNDPRTRKARHWPHQHELYVGGLVWNRQRHVKDPSTGRRVSRRNAESEWIVVEVPELRIIDDELWQAVKTPQSEIALMRDLTDIGRGPPSQRNIFFTVTICRMTQGNSRQQKTRYPIGIAGECLVAGIGFEPMTFRL
ncbi:recombinase family protein [Tardiphaga sp. 841_E9_N1_2]|jgi:hypothetical protein|uniref:recombinase family protein n=1 Tax=Tardiphaga sp. 841_E9_N1_2 TaxID=3240762 RepID=UPI003F28647C